MIYILPQALSAENGKAVISCQAVCEKSQSVIGFNCVLSADISGSIKRQAVIEFGKVGITANEDDITLLMLGG
jgi:hypothetical protein